MSAEGWTWLLIGEAPTAPRTRHQHYFREQRSLCGEWIMDSGERFLRRQPHEECDQKGYERPCVACRKLAP